jgi:hypothetical protein
MTLLMDVNERRLTKVTALDQAIQHQSLSMPDKPLSLLRAIEPRKMQDFDAVLDFLMTIKTSNVKAEFVFQIESFA